MDVLGSPLLGTAGVRRAELGTPGPAHHQPSFCGAAEAHQLIQGQAGQFPRFCRPPFGSGLWAGSGKAWGLYKGWSSDNQILESLLQFSTPHPTPGTVPQSVQLLRKAEVREDRLLAWTWPQMASITPPDSSGKSPLLGLWLLEGKRPKQFSSGTVGFLRILAVCRGEKEADHREGHEGRWGQKETEASEGTKSREQGKELRQKGAVRGANPRTDRKPWGCLGRWTPQSRGG